MANAVKKIPDGMNGVRSYICVDDGAGAIEFYKRALGAKELYRITGPDGKLGHAELEIGGSVLMLSDAHPDHGVRSPKSFGGSPVTLSLYVEDVDKVGAAFVAAGGKVTRPIADQFYGDRNGQFEDPFGHVWSLATHVEDVAPDEIKKRAAKLYSGG
jgi:PhnB protein